MNVFSWSTAKQYQGQHTRTLTLASGKRERVYMPPSLWRQYEALLNLENLDEADLVELALQEQAAQHASGVKAKFGECFRAVVTDRVLDWFRIIESNGIDPAAI